MTRDDVYALKDASTLLKRSKTKRRELSSYLVNQIPAVTYRRVTHRQRTKSGNKKMLPSAKRRARAVNGRDYLCSGADQGR